MRFRYYPYGLKIATLSSKKLGDSYEGTLKNNYLYNDKELFDDADLNWYDYGFRNYDPQIGRFVQLDPLTDDYPFLTPYQYASCDPVTNIDIDGLEGGSAVIARIGEAVVTSASNLTEVFVVAPKTIHGVGSALSKAAAGIARAAAMSNLINTSFKTRNVSETTNQNNGVNKNLNAPPPINSYPSVSSRNATPEEMEGADQNEAIRTANGGEDDAYYLDKLKRENIAAVENGPYKGLPIIEDLMKAGRYEVRYSYHKEARKAFGNAVKEAVIWYASGKLIDLALEYRAGSRILPNSGPIMKGMGAASRAEMLAKKLKLNINSATTRQVLNSLDESVESFISKFRKSSIYGELPGGQGGNFAKMTVEEALTSGNTTVRKLLIDNRFVK